MLRFGVLGVEWLLNADMAASATRALWSRDSFMRGVNPDNLLWEVPVLVSEGLKEALTISRPSATLPGIHPGVGGLPIGVGAGIREGVSTARGPLEIIRRLVSRSLSAKTAAHSCRMRTGGVRVKGCC